METTKEKYLDIIPGFSCLKMKEEIQAKIHEETKDMTFEEYRAYLDRNTGKTPFWREISGKS
jgi:hypothetical protein